MSTPTLFPLEPEPIRPSADRTHPVLWLKRLVLLRSPSASDVIRDMEFRRGLNIIQTRQMDGRRTQVAGHSVGKTLLMRLIRYTLGEPHYGSEETEADVARAVESGVVVGHWSVANSDWIVVRPLKPGNSSASYAVPGDGWRSAVDAPPQERTLRLFNEAVTSAVLGGLPGFTLPRGREARWLDVLAWLARDYQCGYRRANEWRHDDANSGPSLDREENGLIMQWIMGLMNAEEIDLRLRHKDLLNRKAEKKREAEREERTLETLRPGLQSKLELAPDDDSTEQAVGGLMDPKRIVTEQIDSLRRLRNERRASSSREELKRELVAIQGKANDAEAAIRFHHNKMVDIERQIQQYESDPTAPYARCQAQPCWIRERARETGADPARDDHLADMREILAGHQRGKREAQDEKNLHQSALEDATARFEAEETRLEEELAGIDQAIGRWMGTQDDVESYRRKEASLNRLTNSVEKLEGEVQRSLKTQEEVRSREAARINRLSEIYQEILQRVFGSKARGKVKLDANGLQPEPDRRLAPAGAALSVMTSVLGLDIACMAASIAGIGHHPRFLMHDSPREGDMEGPLFECVFEIMAAFERMFEGCDPSFQYIITTTTPPPPELADENGPYVRLTLDARNPENHLLAISF